MMEMRPGCEQCDRDLPADTGQAYVCSFECTFCSDCATNLYAGVCPNCGGELLVRPQRPTRLLDEFPAATGRVFKPRP